VGTSYWAMFHGLKSPYYASTREQQALTFNVSSADFTDGWIEVSWSNSFIGTNALNGGSGM
jgi:hypothetical protein